MRLGWYLLLGAALLPGQESRIAGEYVEDRSNRVYGCYCEWSGEGQTGGREAIMAWRITAGEYRGVSLAGLRMVAVVLGEGSLSWGDNPRKSILFLDRESPKARQQAGEAWLRESFGHIFGRVIAVTEAEIDYKLEEDRAEVRIPGMVKVALRRARLPDDVLQGSILWYDPFVPLTEPVLATSLDVSFSGKHFDHRWRREEPGVNGYFGKFSLAAR